MLMQIFKITTVLIPVTTLGVGIFSIFRDPKSKLIKVWFFKCLVTAVWGLGLALLLFASTEAEARACNMILYMGASFIPALFFHFVSELLFKTKKNKPFILFGYLLAFIFLILALNPPWLVAGASPRAGFKFWVDAGTLYLPFIIYFWAYVIAGFFFLIRAHQQSDGIIRKKIFYILIASLVGFIGGGTNFLPQTLGIYPFGGFVVFLYPIVLTYGIFLEEVKIKFK